MIKGNKIWPFRIKLFTSSVMIITIFFFWFTPKNIETKSSELQTIPAKEKVTLIWVREDSLTGLLNRFLADRNILLLSHISPLQNGYDIKIERFGNNIEFYNNKLLCTVKDQGFSISDNVKGGIDAHFTRSKISGIYYVELPTDVFYRLLKN